MPSGASRGIRKSGGIGRLVKGVGVLGPSGGVGVSGTLGAGRECRGSWVSSSIRGIRRH